jgi:Zn-dependent protease
MVLNLIPILPLDGGRVLDSFLPWKWSQEFRKTERFGLFVIIILLLLPPVQNIFRWLGGVAISLLRQAIG